MGSRQTKRGSTFAAALAGAVLALAAVAGSGSATTTAPPQATTPPTISGNPSVGQTLTAENGTWTQNPVDYLYQWRRCGTAGAGCSNIGGASKKTYVVRAADAGHTLRVLVTARNSQDQGQATSAPTAVVAGNGAKPANTSAPTIQGNAREGETLTAQSGTWTGSNPISYAFQWRRCGANGGSCSDISGARAQTYRVTSADVGATLRVDVTASNSGGSATATSAQTPVVASATSDAPRHTAPPTIAGTPREGERLVASTGTWDGAKPFTYDYQWQRCDSNGGSCASISGANDATYTLTNADVGKTLRVVVTAKNKSGTGSATSVPTAVIAKADVATGNAVAIGDVSLPNRLIIDRVSFSPNPLRSRSTVTARFHVADSKGRSVQGALVYVLGVPYGLFGVPPETATGADGYATFSLHPTSHLAIKHGGAMVFFLRARKPGENLLAGVSTRRLVQMSIG